MQTCRPLRRDQLEAELRREYEQRLAEKIEHYQDDMDQRLQALEQEYEDRIKPDAGGYSRGTYPFSI